MIDRAHTAAAYVALAALYAVGAHVGMQFYALAHMPSSLAHDRQIEVTLGYLVFTLTIAVCIAGAGALHAMLARRQ